MRRLTQEEQVRLKETVLKKLKIYEEMQKKINNLLEQEPFKTQYIEINKIKNRVVREERLKRLHQEINLIIKNKKGAR